MEDVRARRVKRAIERKISLDYQEKGLFKRSNYKCRKATFLSLQKRCKEGFRKALDHHRNLGYITRKAMKDLNKFIDERMRIGLTVV